MDSQSLSRLSARVSWALIPHALVILALVTTLGIAAASAPTASITNIQITNVREGNLVISWATSAPANGLARCFTTGGALVQQASDSVTNTTTHYVVVSGLNATIQYLCEVESDGTVANNDGARYAVTTGPVLAPPPPSSNLVYGFVFKPDGATVATNVFAYLRLVDADGLGSPGRSQWGSARTASNGVWYYNLDNLRIETLSDYFHYTPGVDNLEIWIQGGVDGTWGRTPEATLVIPGVLPAQLPNAVLNGSPLAVMLDSFFVTARADGVLITWETTSEIGNRGFNLFRALDPAGPQNLLAFVPSHSIGSTQGFVYEWLDTDVVGGQTYFYWLETVSIGGTTTRYGPVSITYQVPTAIETTTLTAQASDSRALMPWLLVMLILLSGVAYGLCRRSRRLVVKSL